jgi:ligand-binding sensor domain-containing protein/signal transduction histidine kinase
MLALWRLFKSGWIFWFLCTVCQGQVEVLPIDKITIEDGLSHGTIWAITKDKTGIMWFGSPNGLDRYDGQSLQRIPIEEMGISDNHIRFIQPVEEHLWIATGHGLNRFDPFSGTTQSFFHEASDVNTISSNYVNIVQPDGDQGLWIGTIAGLDHFDLRTGRITRHDLRGASAKLSRVWVRTLLREANGFLWVGLENGLILKHPDQGLRYYEVDPEKNNALPHGQVRTIFRDSREMLWIGTSQGLRVIEPGTQRLNTLANLELFEWQLPTDLWINSIQEDIHSNLWIATRTQGVFVLNRDGKSVQNLKNDGLDKPLPSNNIVDLFATEDGLMWAGSYKAGLAKANVKMEKFRLFRVSSPQGPIRTAVPALAEDSRKRLWLAHPKGLHRYDPTDDSLLVLSQHAPEERRLQDDAIMSMMIDRKDRVWVGTYGYGLHRYDQDTQELFHYSVENGVEGKLQNAFIQALADNRLGDVYVGTREGLYRLDVNSENFHPIPLAKETLNPNEQRVQIIHIDDEGTLRVGTNSGMVVMLGNHQIIARYRHDPEQEGSLNHDLITALLVDSEERLWVGSRNGLNFWVPEQDRFRDLSELHPSLGQSILGLIEGQENEIWVSSNNGLVRIQFFEGHSQPFSAKGYSIQDGLQGQVFLQNSFYKTPEGEILIGGINGYNRFFPNQVRESRSLYPLVLSGFQIFNKDVNLTSRQDDLGVLNLDYKENFFSFEFSSLDYTSPGKTRYRYRLENLETQWSEPTSRNYVSYTNLDGGNYTLRVRSSNRDGIWNPNELVIPIVIHPPIWQRPLFIGGMLWVFVLLAFMVNQYRLRDLRRRNRQLQQETDRETEALRLAHERLAEEARKAGMAEIATGVLHNIGNILNTVTTSANQILSSLNESLMQKVRMANSLLKDVDQDYASYFRDHPKGKLLPQFYARTEAQITKQQNLVNKEIEVLLDKVSLMGEALTMELSFVGRYGTRERVQMSELVNNALRLQESFLKNRDVTIVRRFNPAPSCLVEAHKIVHVVTNLIKNAADALSEVPHEQDRKITIEIHSRGTANEIVFIDNGCGISKENLDKMFSFGFTTKEHGHGFGLHSCRNTMQEIGGDLTVQSEGTGRGATFILTVPLES